MRSSLVYPSFPVWRRHSLSARDGVNMDAPILRNRMGAVGGPSFCGVVVVEGALVASTAHHTPSVTEEVHFGPPRSLKAWLTLES